MISIPRREFTVAACAALAWPQVRAAHAWRLASGYRSASFQTVNLAAMARDVGEVTQGRGRAFAEGRIDSMITSAVTGAENKVWSHAKHYYDINAWFPKNLVFANAAAMSALDAPSRDALLAASARAEQRGWSASSAAAVQSVDELRRNGMKVERTPPELGKEIKRFGERFSIEWIRQVGPEANGIFVPYFTQG